MSTRTDDPADRPAIVLGLAGVFVFFALSGFLVTQSYEQTHGALRYLVKRALRILPGLFVALILTAFVLAPLVTSLPLGEYLRRPSPTAMCSTISSSTTGRSTNCPAWCSSTTGRPRSQRLAVDTGLRSPMYLMVLALGSRVSPAAPAAGALVLGLACIHFPELDAEHNWALLLDRLPSSTAQLLKASPWFNDWLTNIGGWSWLLAFFAAGMVLYKLRGTRIFDWRVALLAVAGFVASIPLRQFILLFPLFGCYLALYLALNPRLPVIPAARFGDLSWPLYLWLAVRARNIWCARP